MLSTTLVVSALLSFLLLIGYVQGQEGHCVMYGKCGQSPAGTDLNCVDNNPARKLDAENLATLSFWCPELVATYGDSVCCTPDQLLDLTGNLNLPSQFLSRCPSCYYNFRQMFCHLACSPYQSQFLVVNETLQNEDGQEMVYKLSAVAEQNYVDETFEACKDIKWGPDNANYALDVLCGPWGAANCSGSRWFEYMGSTANGFAPFDIMYSYVPPEEDFGFHQETFKCTEIPTNANSSCTCVDCLDACLV